MGFKCFSILIFNMTDLSTTATDFTGRKRNPKNLNELPPGMIIQIYALSEKPEYTHGSGCRCQNKGFNKCPGEGVPNYRKIAKELGIDHITVHMYLDDSFREHRQEKFRENEKTAKNRESRRKKRQTEEYKESLRRYRETESYAKSREKYEKSEKFIKKSKRASKRYYRKNRERLLAEAKERHKTQAGKEQLEKWSFIKGSSLMVSELRLKPLEASKRRWIDYFNVAFDAQIKSV